jgi:hypothetical protein
MQALTIDKLKLHFRLGDMCQPIFRLTFQIYCFSCGRDRISFCWNRIPANQVNIRQFQFLRALRARKHTFNSQTIRTLNIFHFLDQAVLDSRIRNSRVECRWDFSTKDLWRTCSWTI